MLGLINVKILISLLVTRNIIIQRLRKKLKVSNCYNWLETQLQRYQLQICNIGRLYCFSFNSWWWYLLWSQFARCDVRQTSRWQINNVWTTGEWRLDDRWMTSGRRTSDVWTTDEWRLDDKSFTSWQQENDVATKGKSHQDAWIPAVDVQQHNQLRRNP